MCTHKIGMKESHQNRQKTVSSQHHSLSCDIQVGGEPADIKSEWVANLSHELHAPLNRMLILAQQLLANNKPDNLTDKPVEDVQRILSCGSNLLTLINEILAVNWAVASGTKTSTVTIVDERANLQPADKSILIIEEDRRFSSVLRELAQAKGFKCIIAEEGKTGLQLALKYQPNAIILDVDLPHRDGWTIMEKLKENLDIRHIPVYLFSAADAFIAAKKRGAIGYLHKPMSMAQLREIFKKIEQFLTRCVKNLLVVVDFDVPLKKILE